MTKHLLAIDDVEDDFQIILIGLSIQETMEAR